MALTAITGASVYYMEGTEVHGDIASPVRGDLAIYTYAPAGGFIGQEFSYSGSAWFEREQLAPSADGKVAGNVVLSDKPTTAITGLFQVSAIGDIQGEAVELDLTGLGVTRYRVKPSAAMRVCEDAINVTQAEDWLEADATTWAALADGQRYCHQLVPTLWSDWRYFSEGNELTNLWFLRDAAGTATATALVEYE